MVLHSKYDAPPVSTAPIPASVAPLAGAKHTSSPGPVTAIAPAQPAVPKKAVVANAPRPAEAPATSVQACWPVSASSVALTSWSGASEGALTPSPSTSVAQPEAASEATAISATLNIATLLGEMARESELREETVVEEVCMYAGNAPCVPVGAPLQIGEI